VHVEFFFEMWRASKRVGVASGGLTTVPARDRATGGASADDDSDESDDGADDDDDSDGDDTTAVGQQCRGRRATSAWRRCSGIAAKCSGARSLR
jgi:hypothetical protein